MSKLKTSLQSAVVQARMEPELKQEAEAILKELGLNTSEAIKIFFRQIRLHQGIPFELKVPNPKMAKVLDESQAGNNLVAHDNVEDMFAFLDD